MYFINYFEYAAIKMFYLFFFKLKKKTIKKYKNHEKPTKTHGYYYEICVFCRPCPK